MTGAAVLRSSSWSRHSCCSSLSGVWTERWIVPTEVTCSLPAEQCPISSQYQITWTNAGEYVAPDSFTFGEPPVVLAETRRPAGRPGPVGG